MRKFWYEQCKTGKIPNARHTDIRSSFSSSDIILFILHQPGMHSLDPDDPTPRPQSVFQIHPNQPMNNSNSKRTFPLIERQSKETESKASETG